MIIGFLSFLHLFKVLLQLMQCFSVDAHFNCIIFLALKWRVSQILDSFGVNKRLSVVTIWNRDLFDHFLLNKLNEIKKNFFSIFKKIILFSLNLSVQRFIHRLFFLKKNCHIHWLNNCWSLFHSVYAKSVVFLIIEPCHLLWIQRTYRLFRWPQVKHVDCEW